MPHVFKPFPEGHGDISRISGSFLIEKDTVAHQNLQRFTAIEAGEIDLDCFTGVKPADRQRFKASLAEPFLLPVNRDAVVGRKVVEGCEGDDVVGLGVKPTGHAC